MQTINPLEDFTLDTGSGGGGGGGTINGSGTTGYLPVFTGSTTLGNSGIFRSSTKYGVNTGTPLGIFDIQGTASGADNGYGLRLVPSITAPAGYSFGLYSLPTLTNSTTGNESIGAYFGVTNSVAGGITVSDSITVLAGANTKSGLGTVTRGYGIWAEPPTAGTTNYAARLNGATGIAMDPARPLDVNGIARAFIEDNGGQVFNVKAYGAGGAGATDDTAAINAAITAAAAVKGVVFFPPGTYTTTGLHNLDGMSGLQIVGSGVGATVININHATNTLFTIGTVTVPSTTVTRNLGLHGFTVDSLAVTRSGGWVFDMVCTYTSGSELDESRFSDIDMRNQFNGIWVRKYQMVWMNRVTGFLWVDGASTGIKLGQTTTSEANQGSGAFLTDCVIYGNILQGGDAHLDYGFYMEGCDAVTLADSETGGCKINGFRVVSNNPGHSCTNIFLSNTVFDATETGACVEMVADGTSDVQNAEITGCWFSSAGEMPGGAATVPGLSLAYCKNFVIQGCRFWNSKGPGLYLNQGWGTVTGNNFHSNGIGAGVGTSDSIQVLGTLNNLCWNITGNFDAGSAGGGKSIVTDAGCNRLVLLGNTLVSGKTIGAAGVDDHNLIG